jgi:hypothetical protein
MRHEPKAYVYLALEEGIPDKLGRVDIVHGDRRRISGLALRSKGT